MIVQQLFSQKGTVCLRRSPRVAFVSLGCAKNLVDSEKMLGLLAEAGVAITADEADADVLVVNTCGFLAASREEAHREIARAVAMKRNGRCRRVVVAGCLVERDGQRLLEDVPGIDALVGVHRREEIVDAVLEGLGQVKGGSRGAGSRRQPDLHLGPYHPHIALDTARLRLTPRHYAYLRISEGCDQKCTFCTIPAIRGPMRSKPPEAVLAEARELIADGVFELNIIGQDTTSYGRDIGYAPGLAGLLRALDDVEGVGWIRLLYAYPSEFGDDVIDAIGECARVVKYVDLPLQHISDGILKRMRRRVTRARTEGLLQRLRDRLPGVAIRTTFIAGFPGETQAQFEELLDFVRAMKFAAVGVFPYSTEPDTPAGRMPDDLPPAERQARADAIMAVQQEVAFEAARAWRGRFLDVLVDQPVKGGQYAGRHPGQAPEVDAVTYLLGGGVKPGRLVRALCEGSEGYDLIARPTNAILPVR